MTEGPQERSGNGEKDKSDAAYSIDKRDILAQLLGRPPEPNELEGIAGRKEEIFRMEAQWH